MDSVLTSIADGVPVDWSAVEVAASCDETTRLKALHIIQDVANFYRLSAYDAEPCPDVPPTASLDEEPTVEVIVGKEDAARYQVALRHLTRADRHAVIGRLELLSSYTDLGAVLGYHNRGTRWAASAARHAVTRALRRLAAEMSHV